MTKTLAAKIAKYVSYVVALIVVIHPGWHQPAWVSGAVGAAALLTAGALQVYTLISHHVITITAKAKGVASATIPKWFDANNINQIIETLVTAIIGIIALFHPGFKEPTSVQSLVATLSGVIVILVPYINSVFKKKTATVK